MDQFKPWILPNGMIKHYAFQGYPNENSILETIIWSLLYDIDVDHIVFPWIEEYIKDPEMQSHDNITAAIIYCAINRRQDLIDKVKILPKHAHPRDIIFILYMQGYIWGLLLLPLLIPIFVYMLAFSYKYRPDLLERFNRGLFGGKLVLETPMRNTIEYKYEKKDGSSYIIRRHVGVDTERIYWLRQQLPKRYIAFHIIDLLIDKLFKLKYHTNNWFYEVNKIYFEDQNHPNIKE